MDKRKLILLKYLLEHSAEGYKVLDTPEVMNAVGKYKGDYQQFETDIYALKSLGYIDLKYIDQENLCLSIADNSHVLQENMKIQRISRKSNRVFLLMNMLLSGLMAFVGAFLACIIFR